MLAIRALSVSVVASLLVGCGGGSGAPPPNVVVAPVVVGTGPASPAAAPAVSLTVDGAKLGDPIGALMKRAPYEQPCDVDAIDHDKATLYFWAAGECRKAPPFPGKTTLVILTPPAARAQRAEQPMVLIAWAGGSYFDDKTGLPVRIGDSPDHLVKTLGAPTATKEHVAVGREKRAGGRLVSWGRVHALVTGDKVVALAVGELDIKAEGELAETLQRLYKHHLRYAEGDD